MSCAACAASASACCSSAVFRATSVSIAARRSADGALGGEQVLAGQQRPAARVAQGGDLGLQPIGAGGEHRRDGADEDGGADGVLHAVRIDEESRRRVAAEELEHRQQPRQLGPLRAQPRSQLRLLRGQRRQPEPFAAHRLLAGRLRAVELGELRVEPGDLGAGGLGVLQRRRTVALRVRAPGR